MRRGDSRLATGLCVAGLILVSVLAIHAFEWLDPQRLRAGGMGDYTWFTGPYAFYLDASIGRGEWPLWNPLLFCGAPFAADPQAMAFYPPNLLRSLLTLASRPIDTYFSFVAMLVFHLALCGSATFLLMRAHGGGRLTSALAGFIVVQCGCFAVCPLATPVYVFAFTWTPLVLLCMRRASQATGAGAIRWLVAGGLAFGLTLLAGYPPLAGCTAAVGAAYFCLNLLLSEQGATTPRGRSWVSCTTTLVLRISFCMTILFGVAALAAATLLIPGYEFVQLSTRTDGAGAVLSTNPDAGFRSLSLAVSLHPFFLLALVAALMRGGRRTWLLLAPGLLALDFAVGPPMPASALVHALLPYPMSFTGAMRLLSAFWLSLVAAQGVSVAWDASTSARQRAWLGVAMGGVALAALAVWASIQGLGAVREQVGSNAGLISVGGVFVLVLCFLVSPRSARWLAGGLCLFGVIAAAMDVQDVRAMLEKAYPAPTRLLMDRPSFWREEPRLREFANQCLYALRSNVGGYDSLQLNAVAAVLKNPGTERQYERCIPPEAMARNPHVDLFLTRAFWLARTYYPGALPGKDKLFLPSRVVFLPEAPELPVPEASAEEIEQPWQGAGVREERIWQKDFAVAGAVAEDANGFKATLALRDVRLSGQQTLLRVEGTGDLPEAIDLDIADRQHPECSVSVHPSARRLAGAGQFIIEWPLPDAKSVDIRLGAAVRSPGRCEISSVATVTDLEDERDLIRLVNRGANEVEVETHDLPAARILLFTDAYYPGWQAEMDGQPAPIYRANDAFKAVVAPAGTHRIRFVFRPRLVWIGLSISTLTTLAALVYLCWPWATAFFTLRRAAR